VKLLIISPRTVFLKSGNLFLFGYEEEQFSSGRLRDVSEDDHFSFQFSQG